MPTDELVNEIITIVQALSEQEMSSLSPDTLSRLVLKLASYKASLGEPVAKAYRVSLDAEARYYEARATEYQRLRAEGSGSTDAGELKHLRTEEFLSWNEARHDFKRLSQLSTDCHDLIDSIRGRLISLNAEMRDANAS